MYYRGYRIRRFFILDVDNNTEPHTMLDTPGFYQCPDDPHVHMSASQMRDMMNVVASVAKRVGGSAHRIEWWVELKRVPGVLVPVDNYNDLSDDEEV